MRGLSFAVLLAFALLGGLAAAGRAEAAWQAPPSEPTTVVGRQEARPVDDSDDTRVEVQLVVLGIAAGVVVGVGSTAYLLRRKLGLVAPPPEQDASAHH